MQSTPKRHHWWPECHSKLWVDDEGCITSVSVQGGVLRRRPGTTAVIGHFNSVRLPDGGRDTALETFFADEIDSPAAPVLLRLASERRRDFALEARYDHAFMRAHRKGIKSDGFVPDQRAFSARLVGRERRALANYVASLIVRIPSYKSALNSGAMLGHVAKVLGVDGADAVFHTDTLHVEIVRQHIDQYATALLDCEMFLIDAGEHEEFLIGDTPVITAALGFGESEAMMPISPARALVMIRGWKSPLDDRVPIFRAQRKSVRAYNKTMVQNAEREVFGRVGLPLEFVRSHLGTRQVRLAPELIEPDRIRGNPRGPMLDHSAA